MINNDVDIPQDFFVAQVGVLVAPRQCLAIARKS
jgi:hypothetical protein